MRLPRVAPGCHWLYDAEFSTVRPAVSTASSVSREGRQESQSRDARAAGYWRVQSRVPGPIRVRRACRDFAYFAALSVLAPFARNTVCGAANRIGPIEWRLGGDELRADVALDERLPIHRLAVVLGTGCAGTLPPTYKHTQPGGLSETRTPYTRPWRRHPSCAGSARRCRCNRARGGPGGPPRCD